MARTYDPTMDCIACGCPCGDHIAIRYVVKAWIKHRVCLGIGIVLGRFLRDVTGEY